MVSDPVTRKMSTGVSRVWLASNVSGARALLRLCRLWEAMSTWNAGSFTRPSMTATLCARKPAHLINCDRLWPVGSLAMYTLTRLLNKFKPGAITRVDPREDGFAKMFNVTHFLAGVNQFGLTQDDTFARDDLLNASGESLNRVAQTIIALCKIAEPTAGIPARSPYSSTNVDTFTSSSILPTSGTPSLPLQQDRPQLSQFGISPLSQRPSRRSGYLTTSQEPKKTSVGRNNLNIPEMTQATPIRAIPPACHSSLTTHDHEHRL